MQRRVLRGVWGIVGILVLLALSSVPGTVAATAPDCTVTTTANAGAGSLRDCVLQSSVHTVGFDPGVTGTITLTSKLDLPSNPSLEIFGPGADVLAIDANAINIMFNVRDSNSVLKITDLTLQHSIAGVAISFGGTLSLTRCHLAQAAIIVNQSGSVTVNQSRITGGVGAGGVNAEGIYNGAGGIHVNNSTISGTGIGIRNSGGGGEQILGLPILGGGNVTVANSTFIDNPNGAIAIGSGSLSVTNSTFSGGNSAFGIQANASANIITVKNSTFTGANTRGIAANATLTNTIVAGNSGGDLDNQSTLTGNNNLIGDNSAITGNNNIRGNAVLDATLRANGATDGTMTLALLPGSPAIGAGGGTGACGTNDARGVARPATNCDIGAFQSQGFTIAKPPTGSGDNQTGSSLAAFPNPLVTTVTSAADDPVAGGLVAFTAPGTNASTIFDQNPATIAADGTARVTATANGTRGSYSVGANIVGASSGSISFALTNIGTANATYVVDNNGNGTGIPANCPPGGGNTNTCTLRDALTAADSGTDTITFKGGLTSPVAITSTLNVTVSVTVTGPGAATLAIDGGGGGTLFSVSSSAVTLTINGLTLQHSTNAIENRVNGGYDPGGTLIVNHSTITSNDTGIATQNGSVTIQNSVLSWSTNSAISPQGSGTLTITGTIFTGNTFAIFGSVTTATMTNSTMTENSVFAMILSNPVIVTNSTVTNNGVGLVASPLTIANSIIAGNTSGDLPGVQPATGDYNLIGDGNGISGNNNLSGNARLDTTMRANGATDGTATFALLPGSPAIGAGGGAGTCGTTDARGVARPATHCDIGAYQSRPFTVAATSGSNQFTPIAQSFANPFIVTVTGTSGDPVAGGLVLFTPAVSAATATLSGTPAGTATIGASGSGQVTATASNTPGSYLVNANVPGATSGGANFTLTNTGLPASITVTAGTPQSATTTSAFATALTATVKDAGNNNVGPGVSITFTVNPLGSVGATFPGNATAATVTTDANSVATAPTLTAGTSAGAFTVTANLTAPATPLSPAATFALTNVAGVAKRFIVTTSLTTLVAGTPMDIIVKVLDVNNNPATGYSGTVQFTSNDPLVSPGNGLPANYTFTTSGANPDNGVHTFTGLVTLKTAGTAQFVKATDSLDRTVVGQQSTITVTAGTATKVVAKAGTTPQSAQVGHAFTNALAATVTDSFGNPVGARTVVTYTLPGSGASGTFAGGATATTDATGVATPPAFTANATPGNYNVSATISGGTTAASFALTNTLGPPATFALSGASTATATQPYTLTVTANDAVSNLIPTYTGTVKLTTTDAFAALHLPAAHTFTASDHGVFTFTLTLSTNGAQTITATDPVGGLTGTKSVTVSGPAIFSATATAGISPIIGQTTGGTTLTIVGSGFSGVTGVTVGGAACASPQASPAGTQITCTTPAHAAAVVDVVVVTPAGTTTATQVFTYVEPGSLPAPGGRTTPGASDPPQTSPGGRAAPGSPGSAGPAPVTPRP